MQKRIVVTGMGVVSSVGHDLDTFFDNLCAGKSGLSAIESFDCEGWSTRIAGEVKDFDPGELVSRKMARRLDRSIMFSLVAGKRALLDAGLPLQFACAPPPPHPFALPSSRDLLPAPPLRPTRCMRDHAAVATGTRTSTRPAPASSSGRRWAACRRSPVAAPPCSSRTAR